MEQNNIEFLSFYSKVLNLFLNTLAMSIYVLNVRKNKFV